jgi:hypothetical protein
VISLTYSQVEVLSVRVLRHETGKRCQSRYNLGPRQGSGLGLEEGHPRIGSGRAQGTSAIEKGLALEVVRAPERGVGQMRADDFECPEEAQRQGLQDQGGLWE